MDLLTLKNRETITSLEVAELTGKSHSHVMRDIRALLEQGVDQSNFGLVDYKDTKGEKRPMFNLTKKGSLILASGYNALLREKIIDRWEELEKNKTPTTMVEALRLALEQAEKIEEQQKLIEVQKPKAEFYDAVTGSSNTCDMGTVAKVLNMGIGRTKLFEFLRLKGVLQSNNVPYQKYIDRGYFRVIESKYTLPNGETQINFKTVVYQSGVDYIRKLVKGD